MNKLDACLSIYFLVLFICIGCKATPTVTLPDGSTIFGYYSRLNSFESFRGIPYAQPPLGELRFRHPIPYEGSLHGFTADNYGHQCFQERFITIDTSKLPSDAEIWLDEVVADYFNAPGSAFSEDCLNLNVFRPVGTQSSDSLPIMVWIYGGGFQFGSANMYDPSMIIKESEALGHPIIFVSLNYRLGAYGFLGGDDIVKEGSGNSGLLDQRLALQWVADNIAAFGGDPDNVTIFGESAGSISVAHHLVINDGNNTYKGNPLFHAAIMQSGSLIPVDALNSSAPAKTYGDLLSYSGCQDSDNSLECLRGLSAHRFNEAMNRLPGIFSYQSLVLPFMPRFDYKVVSDQPFYLVKQGKYAKVPFIIGNQEDEGTLFALTQCNVTTIAEAEEYIQGLLSNSGVETVNRVMELYPDDAPQGSPYRTGHYNELYSGYKRLASLLGDYVFQTGRRFLLKNTDGVPSYSYLSTYLHGLPYLGTLHSSDLLFGFQLDNSIVAAKAYRQYWISFANYHDPNAVTSLPYWPSYAESDSNLILGQSSLGLSLDDFRVEQMGFLIDNVGSALA